MTIRTPAVPSLKQRKLLSIPETSLLGFGSPSAVRRMIERKELQAVKVGRLTRVTASSIEKFLADRGAS
jgi:excisionase family DNA binding protein